MHCMRQRPDTRRCNAQTRSSHETTRGGACGWHEMMMRLKQACSQGYPESAVYVQIPIGSRNSAIHNAHHTSLRPSSLFEPRHPSLKVVMRICRVDNHSWGYVLTSLQSSKTHTAAGARKEDGPIKAHCPRGSVRGHRCYLHPRTDPHASLFTMNQMDACE